MKNENAIMDRIKARIAYHANEHRHTYEIGKGVMDFLARDLLADFKAAGGLLPPVALDGDVKGGGLNEKEEIKPSEVEI